MTTILTATLKKLGDSFNYITFGYLPKFNQKAALLVGNDGVLYVNKAIAGDNETITIVAPFDAPVVFTRGGDTENFIKFTGLTRIENGGGNLKSPLLSNAAGKVWLHKKATVSGGFNVANVDAVEFVFAAGVVKAKAQTPAVPKPKPRPKGSVKDRVNAIVKAKRPRVA